MKKENYKIMVVDDSKFMRTILEGVLKREGYSVKSYESAVEAYKDIDNFNPHLILSDFLMDEMNGYEFCEIVKKEENRDIKFILVTSVTDVDNKVKCFKVGADDYITKPFNAEEVLARVATHLRIKNLTDELQIALDRINRELEIVRKIQLSFVPQDFPKYENIRFSGYYNIMNKTGGDYLDFLNIDDKNIGVIVADVEGHGVYSTVFMAIIKTILHTDLKNKYSPSEALNILNNDILSLTSETKFATVFYGIINIEKLNLKFSNAGHSFPIVLNKETGEVSFLECKRGFPVGLFPSKEDTYITETKELKKGERYFIFTDGIVEAKNSKNELFSEERLINIIKATSSYDIDKAKELIINNVIEFSENNLNDDVTLLIFEVA